MEIALQDPYSVPERRRPSDGTHLVNGVRAAVDAWRANGYPEASHTSRRLLQFWFDEEHRTLGAQPFRFYFCQREAVETFIYLMEIARVRSFRDLLDFATQGILIDPQEPRRPRFAIKMATGSGKTMAMTLCIVWSYYHALQEPASPMATSFLVLAPNVIVFERLRVDFGDGATFQRDPVIPPEWLPDFDMAVVLQDEATPVTTQGALYLTNVQRLYESRAGTLGPVNPIDAMVGRRVNRDTGTYEVEALYSRIARHRRLMVVNDEAHHVWSPKLKWNQMIDSLHGELSATQAGGGVVTQLDFSATPKDQRGFLFRHTVVDYPLAAAVECGIVKTPVIGEVHGASVQLGNTALEKYRQWIDIAVGRWRKFDEVLSPSGRRPVLFVMCENTQAADEVGDHLRHLPDFAGDRLLVIHTNQQGDITKADLEPARRAAREVDSDDSSIRCIVSVLMLREGWDVRNVCVIVTLRSLSSKAKILPEQALGRGLRRMTPPGSGFDERVVVIEHDAFRDLWSAELDGGLVVDREDAEAIQPGAITVFVDQGKLEYDIAIPQLSRVVSRVETSLDTLTAGAIADPSERLVVPDVSPDDYITYRGIHLISRAEIERHEFLIPYVEDPQGAIAWYTKAVAHAGGVDRLSGHFAALAPLVRDYLENRIFERSVDLSDKVVLKRLAENDAQRIVRDAFVRAIRDLTIREREVSVAEEPVRVSETPAFPWSRRTVQGQRSVFNITPIDSSLEGRFTTFLDRAVDVAAFAKLTMSSRFALEYLSTTGALRYYYPDFVVRLIDGNHLVVETKGLEDIEVVHKDRRARRWCRDATSQAGVPWAYVKVPESMFGGYTGGTMEGLRRFVEIGGTTQGSLA